MRPILGLFSLYFSLILFGQEFPLQSQDSFFSQKRSINGFGGVFVNSDLAPISFQLDFKYQPSYIWGFGFNQGITPRFSIFQFELEGILARHTGAMNHYEAVGVGIARIPNLFGSNFSLAVGEGISFASRLPRLENWDLGYDKGRFVTDDVESRATLNYLLFEVDYSIPGFSDKTKIFSRIHHRSGIYGVFCPPTPPCGSNFIVYGFKQEL
ncbi:hypothetical protein LPTSP4_25130 [Leptospira ryugenii]|uniref:Outer membrane protein n=2 Tax=Leptospira ryugenii TaxID=1917863 RepID=A0A2P2E259_9LEPT|nr:hypothetical protein LPTSP4_25130 [Leptospira ryugenii]